MKEGIIYYGIGLEYLSNWTINHALREIYQNFLDYGDYYNYNGFNDDKLLVTVGNNWNPDSLEFLKIGKSLKTNDNSIGKHGEGLKMAFLILYREKYDFKIYTSKYVLYGDIYTDDEIGDCFCLKYKEHNEEINGFKIEFESDCKIYNDFKDGIINKNDILFDDKHYGQIVNKEKGNIYSGNLFVCKVQNLSKSYNINPKFFPLDRDRMIPKSFDTTWATSKINEASGYLKLDEINCIDTTYIDKVSDDFKTNFKPTVVKNNIEFVYKNENGDSVLLKNDNIKNILKKDTLFEYTIKKIKIYLAKKLGVADLLLEFKEKYKYNLNNDAKADLDIIIDRIK